MHFSGGSSGGDYCLALGVVEINTAWSEYRVLRNRAHVWVARALADIDKTVPFRNHTQHSDSGSEFINRALMAYAQQRQIRFVRSRSYCKNDNPAVESRHWLLVRSYVGYRRYETAAEYAVLAELLPLIAKLHNYFMPTMMLIKKVRVGSKVYKTYDIDTPYHRVLKSAVVSETRKQALREEQSTLSYPELLQRILQLTQKLDRVQMKINNKTTFSCYYPEVIKLIWVRFYFDERHSQVQALTHMVTRSKIELIFGSMDFSLFNISLLVIPCRCPYWLNPKSEFINQKIYKTTYILGI